MNLIITRSILHVFVPYNEDHIYSSNCLDLSKETILNFIEKTIDKMYHDNSSKQGVFSPESPFSNLSYDTENFPNLTSQIAERMFQLMNTNTEIPMGDILFAEVMIDERKYLGIIKLNYKTAYTHLVENNDSGINNQIIANQAIFPSEKQKIDEGALIKLNSNECSVIEKNCLINGSTKNYFSELFLECSVKRSPKESMKIIEKCKNETIEKYNLDSSCDYEFKENIFNDLEEDKVLDIEDVAKKTFPNENIASEYLQELESYNVDSKIAFNNKNPQKTYGKQKIKTDTGIEIIVPVELLKDKNSIEFINKADGTVEIMLKNIGLVE